MTEHIRLLQQKYLAAKVILKITYFGPQNVVNCIFNFTQIVG